MTAILAPDRSLAQRREALQRANEIRTKRSAFKRDLKTGRASLPLTLMDPPEWLETAKVADVLLACPKLGRVKVNKILASCRMAPSKTVGGISAPQRAELVTLLGRVRDGRTGGHTAGAKGTCAGTQHMRALANANGTRLARAALKLEIARGTRTIASVLACVPQEAETMTIFDLLMSQYCWGQHRTRQLLANRQITGTRQVGSLTARQRNLLIDALTPDV